ncbi:MAG TPA: glycerophosphodiester phosphodiesterase, partial [Ilumatobacteraceae bacterium]|nr:glycerophosphodiester phosphodiesterase [Ilumatobacteraceae bacterium]
MQQRLPSLLQHPIAFAHRGGKAHAPENTIEAFTLGLQMGATGIESDVWLTSDGVPVLDHDGEVRIRLAKKRIPDLRRDQLPTYIPTLEEML